MTRTRIVATLCVGLVLLSVVGPAVSPTEARPVAGPTWNTSSDWDNAVRATGVEHQSYGDRSSGEIRVGPGPTGANLTSYWPVDTAPAVDQQGVVNLTTYNLNSTSGVYGTSGYVFDYTVEARANASANTAYNFNDGSFTLATWVKTTNTTANQMLLEKRDVADTWAGYSFLIKEENSDGVVFQVGDGSSTVRTTWHTDAYGDGEWHHLAAVYNATDDRVAIYMDGQLKNSTTTGSIGNYNVSEKLAIGHRYGPSSWPKAPRDMLFDGSMDEIRAYDRALTASDVAALARTSGSLTTATKTRSEVHPHVLTLTNISVTRNGGSVNVTVHSDPDGDGTFEEQSAPIAVDGGAPYAVEGLSNRSDSYRVTVELNGTTGGTTPVFAGGGLDVRSQPAIYLNMTQSVYNGGAVDYYATPASHRNIAQNFSINTSQTANLTVTAFNTSNTTVANFTVNMSAGSMNVTIANLTAYGDYTVYQDGAIYTNVTADGSGTIRFSKDSNWSPHTFTVLKAPDDTSTDSDGGGGLVLSGACGLLSVPFLGCVGYVEAGIVLVGFAVVVGLGYRASTSRGR